MARLIPTKHCRRGRRVASVLLLLSAGCLLYSGCSRPFWREQADTDTYDVIAERTADERWDVPRIDVMPDPRSRFFDPYDPDCEPLPPDDPAAHQYMHWVAGKAGYKSWHSFGDAFSVENPQWLDQFRLAPPEGETVTDSDGLPIPALYNVTLVDAVELSNIHSREYQTAIEDLYLTALRLTLSRFQFDVRYLGFGGEPSADLTHTSVPGGPNNLALNSRFGISQLLPSGGQWIVELANNTLWMFSGGNQTSTASVLSYSLVQPLLLGAGRKIVLADLTQGERDVLYATRDLARFRQTFFVNTVSDYLDLILQLQSVLNQRGNIARLAEQTEIQRAEASQIPSRMSELLPVLPPELVPDDPLDPQTPGIRRPPELAGLSYDANAQALYWEGPLSPEQETLLRGLSDDVAFQTAVSDLIQRRRSQVVTLSVAQLETRLVQSRNLLRSAEQRFQLQLDNYKLQRLGLPPDLPMEIDESLLLPFQLIDPALPRIEQTVKNFVLEWARLDDENPDIAELRVVVAGLADLEQLVESQAMALVQHDFDRAANLLAGIVPPGEYDGGLRRFQSPEERRRVESDIANDNRLFTTIQNDVRRAREEIYAMQEVVSREKLSVAQKKEVRRRIAELREEVLRISQSLQVIQIGLRVELIAIQPFTMSLEEAVQAGLDNRLDLKNARAFVMDARRDIEVQANRLEAVLNIRVEGDLRTPTGQEPFDFRGANSSFRAGLAFTAPLDQIAERNAYRASLIDYQRARRAYMQTEDRIKQSIRQSWRQLQVLRQNFEDNRVNVRLSALQYDNAVEEASAPRVAGQGGGGGALDLLRALDDTLAAQENLIGNWVSYEQNRLNIYRDMGIMEIDAAGIWDDAYYQAKARQDTE